MRLTGIAIQKYRSIKRTPRINLADLTVLIGPNNEGKSNILRALVTSMQVLRSYGLQIPAGRSRTTNATSAVLSRAASRFYQWSEDFPKDLQDSSPEGNSIIDLWFELDDEEQAEFYERIKTRLRTELPIRLLIGKKGPVFSVRKQGPSAAALTEKSGAVCQFVGSRLRVEYIESVRTAERAQTVARDMLEVELSALESDENYQNAMSVLKLALDPITRRLSDELLSTLQDFLPDVVGVDVQLKTNTVINALSRQTTIMVDDGVSTDLARKGDGIQSLAALALVRKAASTAGRRGALFLAIEEPEAHLHPTAIHQLRAVLADISNSQQVVITTHSPLLANRLDIGRNIVVKSNQAMGAKSVSEVRDALGVRVSDNLSHAALVLVVEGGCDYTAMRALLCQRSPRLKAAIQGGELGIDSLGSASNLHARLDMLRSQLSRYHVLVDNDLAGRAALQRARDEKLVEPHEENLLMVPGLKESEFEDALDPNLYQSEPLSKFGINLDVKEFAKSKKKWSDRVALACASQGKEWTASLTVDVKTKVAELVAESPQTAMHPNRDSSIGALVSELERRLNSF